MARQQIILENFHLGGISDSKYSGMPNSAYKIEGFNLHEEPGILKMQQAIKDDKASGSADPSAKTRAIVPLGNGKTYIFGEDGQIIERSSAADYSEAVADVSPDEGASDILDAKQWGNHIYYTMPERLGKWEIGSAWGTRDDNYSALNANDEFHPLRVIENKLYVGNGNVVSKVETSTTSQALDAAAAVSVTGGVKIPSTGHPFEVGDSVILDGTTNYDGGWKVIDVPDADHFTINANFFAETFAITDTAEKSMSVGIVLEEKFSIQSFWTLITHLIIGTITEGTSAGSFSGFSHIFNWDTRSIDLTSDVKIEEFGINAFMDYQNGILVQAGKQGNWYSYNGQNATQYKRIPGDWFGTNAAVVEANAISSWKGIPAFGFSNESGNPSLQGVYTLGSYDAKYPQVFNYDFPSFESLSDNTEIGVVERIGEDLVFGMKIGGTAWVKRIDTENKYIDEDDDGAKLETQVINAARDKLKNFKVRVCYRSLPTGSAIRIQQKTNDASGYTAIDTTTWSNKKYVETDVNLINAANIQFRIIADRGTDTSTGPEIESIIIEFNIENE